MSRQTLWIVIGVFAIVIAFGFGVLTGILVIKRPDAKSAITQSVELPTEKLDAKGRELLAEEDVIRDEFVRGRIIMGHISAKHLFEFCDSYAAHFGRPISFDCRAWGPNGERPKYIANGKLAEEGLYNFVHNYPIGNTPLQKLHPHHKDVVHPGPFEEKR